jgi:hypothetical protein
LYYNLENYTYVIENFILNMIIFLILKINRANFLMQKLLKFFSLYLTSLKKTDIFLLCTELIYRLFVSDGRKDGDIHVF